VRVGLTGGIASGKSTAADELRRLGVPVIDYDQLARDVVAPGTPGLAAVVEAFGPGVLGPDGALDRGRLGRRVFASPADRERLEAIVHPLVFEAAERAEADALRVGHGTVVHEIPLLVEDGDPSSFDAVVVVDAPSELRRRRLIEGRGLTEEEADERLAAQADDDARRAAADLIWDGSGSPERLRAQVGRWVRAMREGAASRVTGSRPMRRTELQITEFDDIVDVLRRCQVGHLGLISDGGPYVVPVNFGAEVVDGRVVVWCHGAPEGRKVDAIRADDRVCFEAEVCHEVVTDVSVPQMTSVYESVIGWGRAVVVTDQADALHGLTVLVDAVAPGRSRELPQRVPSNVAVLRIELDRITGKRHPAPVRGGR